jgi:phage gpG-like protein
MASQLEKNIATLAQRMPAIVKALAEEMQILAAGMIAEEMGERAPTDAYRSGASDSALANNTRKNPGTKLRVASGTLVQSFTAGKPYNANVIDVNGGRVVLKIGSTVPYAAIHEYGGTIKHPGGS